MSIKARLQQYCKKKNIAITFVERQCGLSNGYFKESTKRISSAKLMDIRKAFPDLNVEWLQSGEGEMILSEIIPMASEDNSIPLLPISAQGGALTNLDVSVREQDCERIISPIKNVDFAITISGDSMAPDYPNGSQILIKKYDFSHFIEWGRVYVLDTPNGSIVKKLMPDNSPDNVRCESLNPFYPPFSVPLSDIRGMYRVLMVMALR